MPTLHMIAVQHPCNFTLFQEVGGEIIESTIKTLTLKSIKTTIDQTNGAYAYMKTP